jgi:hypothetical protein
MSDISEYLEPMLRAGADVSVREVPAIGHRTTVIAGLWKGPQLVRMVRAVQPRLVRTCVLTYRCRGGTATSPS